MGIFNKFTGSAPPKQNAPEEPETDTEIAGLKDQLAQGNLDGLREYLSSTRQSHDWQDRIYVLERAIDRLPQPVLHFACEKEADAADLALIFTSFYAALARKLRGSGTADKIEQGQCVGAADAIRAAIPAVQASIKLDPDDPTSRVIVLRAMTIFGELRPMQQQFFEEVIQLAPECIDAYDAMAHSLSKRWHGSHEESLAIARMGLAKATVRSDIAGVLFGAHELVKGHLTNFDKNVSAAAKYAQDTEVVRELSEEFDKWTGPGYVPRRSSEKYLNRAIRWFWNIADSSRLAKAKSLVEAGRRGSAEGQNADRGSESAEGSPSASASKQADECLGLISIGADLLGKKQNEKAVVLFLAALKDVKAYQLDSSLEALACLHIALVCNKVDRREDFQKYFGEGKSIVDRSDFSSAPAKVLLLMAGALEELDPNRAIQFFELAIHSESSSKDPIIIASLLRRMGKCYARMGLRDHAAVPLRASVKIYRSSPAEPNFPGVLLDLGNALRKRSPTEAEALYQEAAGLYEAQLNLASATAAWVNLGVLFAEQGRNQEALELYQRALNICEKAPKTPASRISSALNNMAECYRRMGCFAEAHALIDRAVRTTGIDDPIMAHCYSTRGEIFGDEGDVERLLEWTRKAISIREKQASQNKELLSNNYEKEIQALERLGRTEEAERVRAKQAELRALIESTPKSEIGSSIPGKQVEGAVFVEIPLGPSAMAKGEDDLSALASTLSAKIREGMCGRLSRAVTLPDQVTLIFYGPDAEQLYTGIKPILTEEKICAGARVVIQQNGVVREEMVSLPRTSIN
jgi:tetratricopeptide (TPR) repeat protein